MLDIVRQVTPAPHRLELAVEIVCAYVARNAVPAPDLPALLTSVHRALVMAETGPGHEPAAEPRHPAIPIKKSVQNDFIVCLENGKRFKSLKRHLATAHGLTPAAYRAKWGLPKDYPMVAPAYAGARSALARQMGLGRKTETAAPSRPTPCETAEPSAPPSTAPPAANAPRRRGPTAGYPA